MGGYQLWMVAGPLKIQANIKEKIRLRAHPTPKNSIRPQIPFVANLRLLIKWQSAAHIGWRQKVYSLIGHI